MLLDPVFLMDHIVEVLVLLLTVSFGMGLILAVLSKLFRGFGLPLVVIEPGRRRIESALADEIQVVYGDATLAQLPSTSSAFPQQPQGFSESLDRLTFPH